MLTTTEQSRDDMAQTVLARYRRASDYRSSYIQHQGQTVQTLMERAHAQYAREYMPDDANAMASSFGFVPSRYYGVVQQKVNASYDWKLDLVVTSLDSMFTIQPSPEPSIDDATKARIREGVRMELLNKMAETGIADPALLMTADGKIDKRIEAFLQEQALTLKGVEQARIVSAATRAADRMRIRMRDVIVEGGFRQAYADFSFDQILYGRGVMRFPYNRPVSERYHTPSGGMGRRWVMKPTFKHVDVFDFYPIDDSDSLLTNTGNTELTQITKAELINLSRFKDSGYYEDVISDIIEEYNFKGRNWLMPDDNAPDDGVWWDLDETIPMLIHEGFFSGDELAEMGITGVDGMDYVSACVEVVGGRTIRCKLLDSKDGPGRTYFQAPFKRTGKGVYDSIGMAAMLWDSEQRINRLLHIFEHNVDWAARPPIMRNRSAFDNPNDAATVAPNGQYDVEERFGVTGSMPDALRTMNTVSAQYHLILTQVNAILQQADNESGIPAFAYGAQDYGRASLGEFSQRMTNALRTVKGLALQEDFHFIEPCFTALFDSEIDKDEELREGQDVNVVIRGLTGLLQEDVRAQRQQQIIPMVLQLGAQGQVTPQVQQFAIRQLLEGAGFPVDALGMENPIIDNAIAVAATMPTGGVVPMSQQVPQLDGRSGAQAMSNTAQPDGGMAPANLMQVGPIA